MRSYNDSVQGQSRAVPCPANFCVNFWGCSLLVKACCCLVYVVVIAVSVFQFLHF